MTECFPLVEGGKVRRRDHVQESVGLSLSGLTLLQNKELSLLFTEQETIRNI